MSHLPIWLAVSSMAFFWVVVMTRLGWVSRLSGIARINDPFNILPPVFFSLTVPFVISRLSEIVISNFDKILSSGVLVPLATVSAASIAAFMAYRTIENSRKNERIRNTISALNHDLFQSSNLTKFHLACELVSRNMELEPSFKALCRIPTRAEEFVGRFKSRNLKEYETIRDVINYSNNLCYGVDSGIYDEEMINKFLGRIIFEAWWAAMIVIRDEEFRYYADITKEYRRAPDFGPPYSYLYRWIDNISEQQALRQIRFVLGRLEGGIQV